MRSTRSVPRQRRRVAGVARWLVSRALVVLALVAWPAGTAPAGERLASVPGRASGAARLEAPRTVVNLPGEPARSAFTGGRGAVSQLSAAGPKLSALPAAARPDVSTLPVRYARPADHSAPGPGSPQRGPDPCRGPPREL